MKFFCAVLLLVLTQINLNALVAHRNILWVNGQNIKVKFLEKENKEYKAFVTKIAKQWEQHANIKFTFIPVDGGKADIKIYSEGNSNPSSQLGVNSKWVNKSMNLPLYDEFQKMKNQDESDYYFLVMRSAILHEF